MSTLPNNLKQYLFQEGRLWNIYLYQNHYIKMLKNIDEMDSLMREQMQVLLEALQKPKYEHPQIAKIEEIYYDKQNKLIGYRPETKQGKNLYEDLQKSEKPLDEFYKIAKSLLILLKFAQKNKIVYSDMMTEGNLLYERNTGTVNVIDVDGIKIPKSLFFIAPMDLDPFLVHEKNRHNRKYINDEGLQNEFNILSFYEIMFRGLFNESLLMIYSYPKIFPLKDILQEKLDELGFDSKTDLYERMLDLVDENTSNTVSLYDFEYLMTHYRYDESRKKLIS